MYKVSMEEARWGAVCPDTFLEVAHDSRQVLTVHVIYYLSRTHVKIMTVNFQRFIIEEGLLHLVYFLRGIV
jgi:hypothetical protein